MSRSRKTAKAAGTRLERDVADHLALVLDDRIDRRVKTGAKDRGDLGGIRTATGERVVVECKNYGGRLQPGTWISEAHTEAGNDDAAVGVVIAKRKGTTAPGEQWVLMTVDDLVVLLGGPTNTTTKEEQA